jgi:hypothetical protein
MTTRMAGRAEMTVIRRRNHLRLVEPADPIVPAVLTDLAARKQFEQLTQALLDAVIEIMDLADGDPDAEPNGDDEDGDAAENDDGV